MGEGDGTAARSAPADDAWRRTGKVRGRVGFTETGEGVDAQVFARSTGELKAALIGVDFEDAPASALAGEDAAAATYFEALLPGGARWLERSSNGRLHLTATPLPRWLRLSRPTTAYGFRRGLSTQAHHAYIQEAVAAAEDEIDLAAFDLLYIVVPRNAEAITFSPTWVDHGMSVRTRSGHVVRHAVTFGQDMWRWGYKVLDHETGHTLGLPDLYTYQPVGDPPNAHPNVGGWDLMGLISGHAPELLAWQKWRLGWLGDEQVAVIGTGERRTLRLAPVEGPAGIQLAILPLGPGEALALECRRAIGNDAAAQEEGVLVYRVHAALPRGAGPSVEIVRQGTDAPFGPGDLVHACYRADATGADTCRLETGAGGEVVLRVLDHGVAGDRVEIARG
jgi:M6 family metalloprotease-like protein